MASVAEWVEGARPRTLPAAIAPVVAGLGVTGYTGTDLSAMHVAVAALLALLVALALQIGVNYFNDYSDGVRGTDSVRVGPVRLVGQGLAPASQVKRAALLSLGTAAVLGTALVLVSRQWILLPIGVAAVLAAYGYTGGKHPYGYLGLGDVFVFIFFGPVAVCGTTLVTGGGLWPVAVLASIAIGILTVNILVANNLRDRALDERAGKRTLSVRLGEEKTRRLFAVSNMVAFVIVAWLAILATPWALLGMTGAIPAVRASQDVLEHAYGKGLIPVLQMTSLALLLTGLGLGVGLAL
ncbi:MAG: 1,4-dihydroxy-2-naphthoate polyprenyltransferase [Actinobacteria bacterium]|nr:1,4-dihydroxy-2-naphthoate polyprenyltransferase [Micrococcales bacterium]MCB0902774.1 1,4-dihydroxy-2-naphthoate polyprenyltransferase [Actinomycetota bacterium]MCO5298383.1 1,4-dihydroxy-2-naphthoate polyprenyltransferase [Candidatus Nanopelagicales bacterium]MCB9427495.1 1,4-dihydroxy-2-naphthoate polyprenyltransferase [Actinomycetota bacterium]HPE13315.1 1,4-dihydroxy-2-naphthoate polyprenyltransferase [Actinomycetota bacterium]